jgi:hypothetical protein
MSHTQKNSTAYCEENSRYFLDELRWPLDNTISYHMWGNSGKIQSNMVNIHGSLTNISLVYHKLIFSPVLGTISKQRYIHGASFLTPRYRACFAVFSFEQSVLARRRYIMFLLMIFLSRWTISTQFKTIDFQYWYKNTIFSFCN